MVAARESPARVRLVAGWGALAQCGGVWAVVRGGRRGRVGAGCP